MSVCPVALSNALLRDVRHLARDTVPVGASRQVHAATRLVTNFLKKFEDEVSPSADGAALDKFLAVNERCRAWALPAEMTEADHELIGVLKQHVYRFWHSLQGDGDRNRCYPLVSSFGTILDAARAGPGASIGAIANDFYSKMFASPLSMTRQSLLDVYKRHFSVESPRWAEAELLRSLALGHTVVEGNRLAFVPKTWDISRVTCTEPSLNMFYQLGFGAVLSKRLAYLYKIEDTQPYWNRQLAKSGSRTGRLATIDLSSASDSLSLRMLEHVLPKDFLSWLILLRSPVTRLPDGRTIELHMVSTMGNGFTFPLETMLFACCVSAVYEQMGIRLVSRGYTDWHPQTLEREGTPRRVDGNFAVWGDDIICETAAFTRVCRLLNLLGFSVNADKSFGDPNDPFRESCGYDYLRGEDVRPVFVKTLKTVHSRFALVNRLNRWSASQGVPLRHTVRLLLSTLPFTPVPRAENDDAGVKVPFSYLKDRNLVRRDCNGSIIYTRWCPRVPSVQVLDDSFKYPPSLRKKLLYNPQGLFVAAIGGYVRDSRIGMRVRIVPYRTRRGISINWDASPSDLDRLNQGGWRHWASAVAGNLR